MTNSTPFDGLPLNVLNSIDVKLTVLEEQLTQHAEHEHHYPEVATVFDGLRDYVSVIRDSINRNAAKVEPDNNTAMLDGQAAKEVPKIVTALHQWLSAAPPEFPDFIDGSTAKSLFKNALIGDEREDTFRTVRNLLNFLKELILPDEPNEGMLLDNSAVWGLFRILENMEQAIAFELECRPTGGVSTGDYYKQ